MATSVIEAEYPNTPSNYGFLGLGERLSREELDSLADANLFRDSRKIYNWGYAQSYANVPYSAGYILVIPHVWGVTQIAFEYGGSGFAVRGYYADEWTAWKTM